MNITSFNVTDVGFHYVALRVLDAIPNTRRDEQVATITRNLLKYARDNALRLLLPEPRGNFETASEKVCQELVHFGYAQQIRGIGYSLTSCGLITLGLLNMRKYRELRREMVRVHLRTFDNLRKVLERHMELHSIYNPIVESARVGDVGYIVELLKPTFPDATIREAESLLAELGDSRSARQVENALRSRILDSVFSDPSITVPLFRSMSDRLISLRVLNIMKAFRNGCEYARSYSPCESSGHTAEWHVELEIELINGLQHRIFLSEPNLEDPAMQRRVLNALDTAFASLPAKAGYYDLPDVRDFVCSQLRIPEAAFDEGVNILLDLAAPPVTVGLTYDGISGRRKPMVRTRDRNTQVFNLIRRG